MHPLVVFYPSDLPDRWRKGYSKPQFDAAIRRKQGPFEYFNENLLPHLTRRSRESGTIAERRSVAFGYIIRYDLVYQRRRRIDDGQNHEHELFGRTGLFEAGVER